MKRKHTNSQQNLQNKCMCYCKISFQVLQKTVTLQANHQVNEVKFKIIIVTLYFDFKKLTSETRR